MQKVTGGGEEADRRGLFALEWNRRLICIAGGRSDEMNRGNKEWRDRQKVVNGME